MSSPIEIFEKIYEHRGIIDDSNEAYYHIAAASYEAWNVSEVTLEKHLALRLQSIMVGLLIDEIGYKYSKTTHMENRPDYFDYFVTSLTVYRNSHSNNRLIKHAIDYIDANKDRYIVK